jgi:hypothetical protein
MKQSLSKFLLLILCARLSIGCASIIHGTSQDINISSVPDQAEVWIDGARMGTTPTKITLKRKDNYLVAIKKEGYTDATMKIEGKASGWLFGNIIFGGLIGCGVDLINGAAYELKPGIVDINLSKLAQLDGQTIHLDRAQLDNIKQLRLINEKGNPEVVVNIAWAD